MTGNRSKTSVAVRPPEYFGSIPFFALMQAVDVFVLADTFQYSRQSLQNRAKIRKPVGSQWLSIPLADGQFGTAIHQTKIKTTEKWQGKHRRALAFNYGTSAMYGHFEPMLDELLMSTGDLLGARTVDSVKLVHRLFELQAQIVAASELPGMPSTLADILSHFEDSEYWALADTARRDADEAGGLKVLEFEEPRYRQNFAGFEPGMSALDLLLNYGPEGSSYLR